jgi:excisionase family DNA binding protein
LTKFVSSYEAAQILECSPDNIRRMAREGQLRAVVSTRAGRLFSRDDVEQLARARRQSAVRVDPKSRA